MAKKRTADEALDLAFPPSNHELGQEDQTEILENILAETKKTNETMAILARAMVKMSEQQLALIQLQSDFQFQKQKPEQYLKSEEQYQLSNKANKYDFLNKDGTIKGKKDATKPKKAVR